MAPVAVQFGDHFRPGDHLQSEIICGAVQINGFLILKTLKLLKNRVRARKQLHFYQG